MEISRHLKIVICPNKKCKAPIRLNEGRFVGGENDRGGIVIECETCKTVFPCKLTNPYDASSIVNGGKRMDVWTDELPAHLLAKYNISESLLDKLDISAVFNYERPPMVDWSPSEFPLFTAGSVNFEKIAQKELLKLTQEITSKYMAFTNFYLKGSYSVQKSFIIINYRRARKNYSAVFAKRVDSEKDLCMDNLYLIYHSKVDLEYEVDGIYTRDQLILFLERFLNRWRYAAREVLLVVPFIGFNYKSSEQALQELWNWLEINVDIEKTDLITRKGTFNLYRKAQDNSGIDFKVLVELGLLEPLIKKMDKKGTAYFQKSHAKYYVGIYEDYVEVLSGSFNIHKGASFENIYFKRYDKDFFKERYLHMFKDFQYDVKQEDEKVHYMTFGTANPKNLTTGLKELFANHIS